MPPHILFWNDSLDFGFVSLSLCHFPVLQREQAGASSKQFRKPAGCRISYRLSNLTNLQIAWYRTAKFLPDRKELSGLLRAQWKLTYGIYRKEILECGGFMERLSIRIFSVSPRVYRVMAEVYLKLFPEV